MRPEIRTTATFQLEKFKADGTITYSGPEFSNVILDQTLDALARGDARFRWTPASNLFESVCVGSGDISPDPSDQSLDHQIACTSNTITGYSFTSHYDEPQIYQEISAVHEFPIGSVTGNVNEIGLSGAYGLVNRQLIRDENGDIVTITVLEDEGLRVAIKAFGYPGMDTLESEQQGTFDINGQTVSYTKKMAPEILNSLFSGATFHAPRVSARVNDSWVRGSTTPREYSPGSFEAVWDTTWDPSELNGTWTGVKTESYAGDSYVYTFDEGIEISGAERVDLVMKRLIGRV